MKRRSPFWARAWTARRAQAHASAADHRRRGLDEADPAGVIMGRGLATNLGAHVGGHHRHARRHAQRRVNGVEARVRGIFSTSSKGYDDYTLRAPLALAHPLLRTGGAHKWVVVLDETESPARCCAPSGRALRPRAWKSRRGRNSPTSTTRP